jgi:uncharacterized membrane protein
MMTSEASSNKPAAFSNWLPVAFLIAGAVGFIDAAYLTAKHFLGTPVACSLLKGCEQVTTSQYAAIFGVPIAILGVFYYLIIIALSAAYLDSRKLLFLKLIAYLTPFGFLASLRFVYLQIFIIKAICLYCMVSAATSALLFIFGIIFLKQNKKINNGFAPPTLD